MLINFAKIYTSYIRSRAPPRRYRNNERQTMKTAGKNKDRNCLLLTWKTYWRLANETTVNQCSASECTNNTNQLLKEIRENDVRYEWNNDNCLSGEKTWSGIVDWWKPDIQNEIQLNKHQQSQHRWMLNRWKWNINCR